MTGRLSCTPKADSTIGHEYLASAVPLLTTSRPATLTAVRQAMKYTALTLTKEGL